MKHASKSRVGAYEYLFGYLQVGKLYIRYQLDLDDYEDAVVELTDVICLLKDKKELCIQKDHLTAKLDICRCVSNSLTIPALV